MKTGKNIIITTALLFMSCMASAQYVQKENSLNQAGALKLAEQAGIEAQKLDKKVSVAVLNSSGVTLLLLKADNVGPHNTEASRRKAYTSLSTKTPSLDLMKNAANSESAKNLNTLPELLLLGGGAPVWKDGELIGSLGVSGGGSGENDNNIAMKAIENLGFKTNK
ncbi:heme-binding protein [Kaistella flava (ex Peng et al. 2021)]|uniref:Heme-binding protein n=2 Tax=Kaistella flava (ex Peng et al. 2021) TaxID=2038776 RepID=A0A7M2Y6P8_9FLAO|nr:heme-binding protein [Kaistella flava (ex Peng et al. 2021)]QOW09760.1 heme-binding protein [Kaistella flava (ex Peng et al. 2021)]